MCSLLLKGLPKWNDLMISGVALTALKAKIMQEVNVTGDSKASDNYGASFSKQSASKKQVDKSGVKFFLCKKLEHFVSECQMETSEKKKE